MSQEEAEQRVSAQGAQTDKIAVADIVIRNTGSYDDVWNQVEEAWKKTVPSSAPPDISPKTQARDEAFGVKRGRPLDAATIAGFLNRLAGSRLKLTAEDIMAQFGDKAYMLLQANKTLVGIAGWQVENLVVRITDLHVEDGIDAEKALGVLVREIEAVSADLQCEVALVFPKSTLAADAGTWERLGYSARTAEELEIQAWSDAARESMPSDTVLFFKQLRKDRILRPI